MHYCGRCPHYCEVSPHYCKKGLHTIVKGVDTTAVGHCTTIESLTEEGKHADAHVHSIVYVALMCQIEYLMDNSALHKLSQSLQEQSDTARRIAESSKKSKSLS